jgi:acid stress-induced BolA-like protein IbaG/YrbA
MDVARIPEEYKVLRFLNSTPVRVSKSSLERMWASLFSVSVFVFAILAYLGASLEDGNRRCNIQFSTRQKEGFVDVTKDVVQFLPKQPLKIACSCKPHVPAEAHHTRGYWTGPDGLELVEITGAREDVRFVSKGRYTILKLRGKTPCTAAGLYTCHLRGSSRSIRIVMGGCNSSEESLGSGEELENPTSLATGHLIDDPSTEPATTAPSTRPPVKAIPRIIPHLNGKGVTLVLAPVEKTGSDWRMELVLTPANTALPPTVFQQDAGHIMSTVYGLYPGNHYRVDQIVVGEDGSKEIVASGAFRSPPAPPSEPVSNLKLTHSTQHTLSVSWNPPEERYVNHPDGITGYTAEARNVVNNLCGPAIAATALVPASSTPPNSSTSGSILHATLTALEANSLYCVRVYPENVEGRATDRMVAAGDVRVFTKPQKPRKPPKITFLQAQFQAVLVAWQPPVDVEGGINEFIIQYRQNGGEWSTMKEPGYSFSKIIYNVFEMSKTYEIRMSFVNNGGTSPFTEPVGFTANAPVYDIKICRLSSSEGRVTWSVHPRGPHGADLEEVVFTYGTQKYSADAASGAAVIGGLNSGVPYQVTATLKFKQSYFFTPDTLNVGTIAKVPTCLPSRPLSIAATQVTATTFNLMWEEPVVKGEGLHYAVSVDSEQFAGKDHKTDNSSLVVDGLEEALEYEVVVVAINSAGRGPPAKLHVTTKEAVPNGPVRNVVVYATNPTTIMAMWEDPEEKFINAVGGITIYRVAFGLSCGEWSASFLTVEKTATIRELSPDKWYCVRVLPGNHIGVATSDSSTVDTWVKLPRSKATLPVEPDPGVSDINRQPSNID